MPRYCAEPSCANTADRSQKGHWRRFCSPACKLKTRNRDLKRGAQLLKAARAWRLVKRSHAKGAHMPPGGFGRFTALLDEFLREDREMREAAIYLGIIYLTSSHRSLCTRVPFLDLTSGR